MTIRFDQLYSEYKNKISILARRMIHNHDTAIEAAQESWEQIYKSLDSFKSNSHIGTWIYTIAKRTILKHARKERLYSTEEIDEYIHQPETVENDPATIKSKCYDCLSGFNQCLDYDDRLIFILKEMLNLSYKDISIIMDLEEPSIRKRLSRSKTKIKYFLNNSCSLYNPKGTCSCRRKESVNSIQLEQAFSAIHKTGKLFQFYQKAEELLPSKEFLKNFIFKGHKANVCTTK